MHGWDEMWESIMWSLVLFRMVYEGMRRATSSIFFSSVVIRAGVVVCTQRSNI